MDQSMNWNNKNTICRWRNYVVRGIFTFIMIFGFCLLIYGGPLALMVTVSLKKVINVYQLLPVGLNGFGNSIRGNTHCERSLQKRKRITDFDDNKSYERTKQNTDPSRGFETDVTDEK